MALSLTLPRFVAYRGFKGEHPVVRFFLDFCSFECVFVLFLFAGRYKSDPRFSFIPIDPTMLFLALSMAIGIYLILKEKLYLPGLYAFAVWMVFLCYLWFSLIWTDGRSYAREKVVLVTVMDTWCLLAGGMIMASARERVERFMRMVVLFATWLAIEVMRGWAAQGFRGRILINGGDNYLGYGRICAMAAIILMAYWGARRKFDLMQLGLVALMGLMLLTLLVGGGRGPLVAAAVPMMLVAVIGWKITRDGRLLMMKMLLPIVAAMVLVVGGVFYILATGEVDLGQFSTLARFSGIANDSLVSDSDLKRSFNIEQALFWIPKAPFIGFGIGSWPIIVIGLDIQDHPHNIVLELLFETGLIGLALFCALLWTVLRRLKVAALRADPLYLAATMLFLNTLLGAMSSNDLAENRNLFVGLGLMLLPPLLPRDEDAAPEPEPADAPWAETEDDRAAFARLRQLGDD